jgi:hypothetical protein
MIGRVRFCAAKRIVVWESPIGTSCLWIVLGLIDKVRFAAQKRTLRQYPILALIVPRLF